MNAEEAAAASHLTAAVVAQVSTTVEGVHRSVLSRIRGTAAAGVPALTPFVDAVEVQTGAVYATVRGSATLAGHGAALASRAFVSPSAGSAADTDAGAARIAGVAAASGDRIAADPRTSGLLPPMAFRRDGRAVAPSEVGLDRRGLVVFVHGLGGTEQQWDRAYWQAVRDRGMTAIALRYNSGRPIQDNGAELAGLLDATFAAADSPGGLILVGHSMGGLVIRSALLQAPEASWARATTHVVTLGSPHRGAPLEQAAALAMLGLRQFRESAPLATLGDRRSAGIQDLRSGRVHDRRTAGRVEARPRQGSLDHIEFHAVVGTLGDPGALTGRIFGDGMVRPASAAGVEHAESRLAVHRLHRTGHMALLRHPEVAELLGRLAQRSAQAGAHRGPGEPEPT